MYKYIFNTGTSIFFYDKLNRFINNHGNQILLSGVAVNDSPIGLIKFTENTLHNECYYRALIKSFQKEIPLCKVQLLNKKRLEIEIYYFIIKNSINANCTYIINNTMNWTNENNFCCQVWDVGSFNQEEASEFWSK